jgi:hypothetical protein
MKYITTLLIISFCFSVSLYADDSSTTTEDGREYIDEKPEGDIPKQNMTDKQNVKKGADNITRLESEIQIAEFGRTALETQAKNTKVEKTKRTTTGASEKDISGMKAVIDIANISIQSEISTLKKHYKDELNILYEDMSRNGQLNGTPMLGRLSELCLNEIEECAQLIHNTLLRVVKNSGISYSDELEAELKNVIKNHLTGEIGNIREYIKQKNKLGPTLEAQLAINETELNNKRSNELKRINTEIDLLAVSLKNHEKDAVKMKTSEKQVKTLPQNSSLLHKYRDLIIIGLIVTVVGGLILHFITKSTGQKQINQKSILNEGDVVEWDKIQGDKVLGNKNVYQGQMPDTSLVSYFQDALSKMPELLMDMARALKDEKTKLIREFFVLRNRHVTIGISDKPRLIYLEEDYENLQNKLGILEDYSFITDVRVGDTPIYRMTPEFVQFLLTEIEIT